MPDGAFNIEKPAWQKVASTAIANGLQASFNGVKPRIMAKKHNKNIT